MSKLPLNQYIYRLLFEQDCIVVPDFGGFITNFDKAAYEADNQTYSPPRRWVAFNEALKVVDDGLLSAHVARQEHISREEAILRIRSFVSDVKRQLVECQEYTFEKIGTFTLNSEGKLQFVADGRTNFLPEGYSLPTLKVAPQAIEKEEVIEPEIPQYEGVSENLKTLSKQEVNLPPRQEVIETQERIKSVVRLRRQLPLSVFLLGGLLLGGLIGIYWVDKPQVAEGSLNPFGSVSEKPLTIQTVPVPAPAVALPPPPTKTNMDTAKAIVTPKMLEKAEDSVEIKAIAKKQVLEDEAISMPKNRFYVIAGAFGSVQNAKYLQQTLRDKGYEPIILKGDKLIKVAAISCRTHTEAKQKASKLHAQIGENCWVFRK